VVVDGVGLNITVVSYKNRVDFGIVGDRAQIDDAWDFLAGARHALGELEALGGKPAAQGGRQPAKARRTA
jgi:diacylglycerol O-acyltransferase / wax synthase